MRFSIRIFAFLILLVFANLFAFRGLIAAQTGATLTGRVTDPAGAAIAGAQISVQSVPAAGEPKHIVSAGDGLFALTLAAGQYRVTISRDSFTQVVQDITIGAGETRELQIHMELEPLSSKVLVTAQTLPLDADSSPAPITI